MSEIYAVVTTQRLGQGFCGEWMTRRQSGEKRLTKLKTEKGHRIMDKYIEGKKLEA